jgi:hypothetical protein
VLRGRSFNRVQAAFLAHLRDYAAAGMPARSKAAVKS